MGNDWSSESMQRENSVVISTSKLRSERGKRGKIERERERRGKHRAGKVEWKGGMGQIIEKYQRDSCFLAPVSSSRLIADGEELLLPQLVGIGSRKCRKSQPLGIKSRPIIDKRLRDNYSRFIIFGGWLCIEGEKISMVHSIFFSITRCVWYMYWTSLCTIYL